MWVLLTIQIVTIASMPAAYDLARDRGRSARAWLNIAFFIGPLALLALMILGKRDRRLVPGQMGTVRP
jgi:hypothetical protein